MTQKTLIPFHKYQGTGNDFIIIDGREQMPALTEEQIRHLCDRRFGIGADGLMIYLNRDGYDFEMKYYNADGKEGSMCGNGGRCIVRFAYNAGLHKELYSFMAVDGEHEAEIDINGWIRLKMGDVSKVQMHGSDFVLDTGSPHYVRYVNYIQEHKVIEEGRLIRNNPTYAHDGINVNFVEVINDHTIYVRTYERGVENETLSCGTGVTASALVSAHNDTGFNQVNVQTLGGKLSVEFDRVHETEYRNIWLCGPAEFVFRGEI
jgi:diaminopimelate epimerase